MPHLRRARPCEHLLPQTKVWLASIPPIARPVILARQFARIANQLCFNWGDRIACETYFDDLLTDRRGGRKGFPLVVLREIQDLRRYYFETFPARPGHF